jgi:hypothetical protein
VKEEKEKHQEAVHNGAKVFSEIVFEKLYAI